MLDFSPFSRAIAVAAFFGQDLKVSETRHEAKLLLLGDSQAVMAVLKPQFLPLPDVNSASMSKDGALLWLSPRQWLLLTTTALANHARGAATTAQGQHSFSVHDVGARFAGLTVQGAHAADFLAAGCSLDLRDRQFQVGRTAQTRIEQVPVILFRSGTAQYEVMVERPLANHLWRWAQEVARDWSNQELK